MIFFDPCSSIILTSIWELLDHEKEEEKERAVDGNSGRIGQTRPIRGAIMTKSLKHLLKNLTVKDHQDQRSTNLCESEQLPRMSIA